MKVHVDSSLCAGFGACIGISDEVFEITDEGYAVVRVSEIPPELEDDMHAAVSQCPANAISITDD